VLEGVGQKHRDLAVFDPLGGAGVLSLGSHAGRLFLRSPVSSRISTAPGVAQLVDHVAAHVVA
jgi:hypothetical protein